jgi:tetratricopeptide (TPR) repeat protein
MRSGVSRILTVGVILSLPAPAVLGQSQDAPSELSDAKPYLPPSPKKSVEIGDFYFKRKKYSAALSRYREATEDDPNYAPAYLGLGRVYEKIGLKQKALEAYRKYLDALPSSKQAEEAKDANQAIDRLNREAKNPGGSPRGPSSDDAAASRPR